MTKKTSKNKTTKSDEEVALKRQRISVTFAILLFAIALFLLLAICSYFSTGQEDANYIYSHIPNDTIQNITGRWGAIVSYFLINKCIGVSSLIFPSMMVLLGLYLIKTVNFKIWKFVLYSILAIMWLPFALHFAFGSLFENHDFWFSIGGLYGKWISDLFCQYIGGLVTAIFLIITLLIFCIFAFKSTLPSLIKLMKFRIKRKEKQVESEVQPVEAQEEEPAQTTELVVDGVEIHQEEPEQEPITEQVQDDDTLTIDIVDNEEDTEEEEEKDDEKEEIVVQIAAKEDEQAAQNLEPIDPTRELSHYKFPSVDLLRDYKQDDIVVSKEEQTENQRKIVTTLKNFGIAIKRIYETIGPTITLYEIVPEDGIKISKIKNLADDIMLSLAAKGIRIIAPMPGKGTVGIEVPNKNPKIVSMKGLITSKAFQESSYELPIAIGRTITNQVYTFDLAKMPHLLVAGATGQGKSVGLNAIITSLLYKKHPSQLKMVLIDPKKVEFSVYASLEKHYLAAVPQADDCVITDVDKVKATLNSLCKEMDARYDLLKAAKVRNLKEYNEKYVSRVLLPTQGHRYLPYIVVVIDEFGDLIMTAGKEVETPIARIAQLARAVGMHMILATQRPSVNIITGIIKANFPARIAFRVASAVDSRTILDSTGAEQLVGRGDMLFSKGDAPERIQCALVETDEVTAIANHISSQAGFGTYFELPEPDAPADLAEPVSAESLGKRDKYFNDVARMAVATQVISITGIQRKFELGFNRAARIMDQMEAAGIVGPGSGSKPRAVLIQSEAELERILNA